MLILRFRRRSDACKDHFILPIWHRSWISCIENIVVSLARTIEIDVSNILLYSVILCNMIENDVEEGNGYADMLRLREDKGCNWEQRETDYQITDINLDVSHF